MYLITTRLDIIYSMHLVSGFMETPKEMWWQEMKRILRHVNGTKDYRTMCDQKSFSYRCVKELHA